VPTYKNSKQQEWHQGRVRKGAVLRACAVGQCQRRKKKHTKKKKWDDESKRTSPHLLACGTNSGLSEAVTTFFPSPSQGKLGTRRAADRENTRRKRGKGRTISTQDERRPYGKGREGEKVEVTYLQAKIGGYTRLPTKEGGKGNTAQGRRGLISFRGRKNLNVEKKKRPIRQSR